MLRRFLLTSAMCCVVVACSVQLAWGQASLVSGLGGPQGFGEDTLYVNDDGYSSGINLSSLFPNGLNYFGATQYTIYVNNNGNVSFSGGVYNYTPIPFPISSQPMIAPYWGDVDTRGSQTCTGCNRVYWDLNAPAGQFTATWYMVGYYSSATNWLNSFQTILTDRSPSFGPGDFDIQFRYNRCEWTTGTASGGSNGLGGTQAQMGFDAGNLADFWSHPDSQTAAILNLCTTSNVGIPGVWEFEVRNGNLFECGNGILEGSELCDDGNPVQYDGCYNCIPEIDADGDSWYDGEDCDDADANNFPGNLEVCDLQDNNCNFVVDEGFDQDGDGWATCAGDCNDFSPVVYPTAPELCDGIDNDCNGLIDDGHDVDGDGWTTCMGDCDDLIATIYPGAPELCNQLDDDCNGLIDDGFDVDGDGWLLCDGDCNDTDASIYPGAPEIPYDGIDQDCDGLDLDDLDGDGYRGLPAVGGTDCDDTDAQVHPGATEGPDGVDNDCDGTVDELTDYYDDDGDGYTELGGDCDDSNPLVHPSAIEVCDSIDQDCDVLIDENTDCYDDDGDGYAEIDGDCNDADGAVQPGQEEIPDNGVDDDCDGSVDGGESDPDQDGYTVTGGDCGEGDPTTHPGAVEICDSSDNDCDGEVDEDTECSDDDGDGVSEFDGDCNDADPELHPAADEVANGVDDDCDGTVDEETDVYDDDGDGVTEIGGDCDDWDAEVHPGATEVLNGIDDDCDGEEDEMLLDIDHDGWTVDDGDCDDINGWVHPEAEEMCDELDNDCNGEVDDGCAEPEDELPDFDLGGGCSCLTTLGSGDSGGQGGGLLVLLLGALTGLVRRRRRMGARVLNTTSGGGLVFLAGLALLGTGCAGDSTIEAVEAVFAVEPLFVDLGVAQVDELRSATFYLHHSSGGAIDVLDVEVVNHEGTFFSMPGTVAFELSRNATEILAVHYLPTEEGYHWATVRLETDGTPGEVELVVRARAARAAASLTPFSIDFGLVAPGDVEDRSVWLDNDGPIPITVVSASTDDAAFQITDSLPIVAEPGTQVEIGVRFSAQDEDSAFGELDLSLAEELNLQSIALRANDCEAGDPAAYDVDGDGYTSCAGDCDDDDPLVWPGHPELADGLDNNCDGRVDEGTELYDDDGDGFAEVDGDCNDEDTEVSPGEEDILGNGIDDDCDGVIDQGLLDGDGDGYTSLAGDCDDADATTFPGASEQPDAVDNDCDGLVDEGTSLYDDDQDGFTEAGGDCDDSRSTVYPGAVEEEDWIDNDCDGRVDEGTRHSDDDSDGYSEMGGDCEDGNPAISPAALEIVGNGVDDDCDGLVE